MSLDLSLRGLGNASGLSLINQARAMGMDDLITKSLSSSELQMPIPALLQSTNMSREPSSTNPLVPYNFLLSANGLPLPKIQSSSASRFEELPACYSKEEAKEWKSCLICGDRATGLHYGIISCEGCKGFFKRSVCNKRVYRCTKDKNCVMSRKQRNRCQYCRLLKCLRMGMNRKAIREDGMPGGRNKSIGPVQIPDDEIERIMSGKEFEEESMRENMLGNPSHFSPVTSLMNPFLPYHLSSAAGSIPTSSLTPGSGLFPNCSSGGSPSSTSGFSSTLPPFPPSNAYQFMSGASRFIPHMLERGPILHTPESVLTQSANVLVEQLVKAEDTADIGSISKSELNESDHVTKDNLFGCLCSAADEMLFRQILWLKKLPFFGSVDIKDHTALLSASWAEIVLLATLCLHEHQLFGEFADVMGKYTPDPDELSRFTDAEMEILEYMTYFYRKFSKVNINHEEYVILKVLNYLNQDVRISHDMKLIGEINKQYWLACQRFVELRAAGRSPDGPTGSRFLELVAFLPEVRYAAAKMQSVPVGKLPLLFKAILHMCRLQRTHYGRHAEDAASRIGGDDEIRSNGGSVSSTSASSEDVAETTTTSVGSASTSSEGRPHAFVTKG